MYNNPLNGNTEGWTTEVCLIQNDATVGKPLKFYIDHFFDITTVHYFKKYNPQSRIQEINIEFEAMVDFKHRFSKMNGVKYSELEFPDIFGPLSPKLISIYDI